MEALEYRFAELRALPADIEETRTVEFIISDETKDRHGTVLKIGGWKLDNYKRNPIVGYQHNLYGDMCNPPNPDDIIGRSKVFMEGEKLIGRVTFEPAELNPLAEKIFRKIIFGTLNTASVGFAPLAGWRNGDKKAGEDKDTQYSDSHELLEWSIVNIPSNPKAGKREFSIQTDRALKYLINLTGGKISENELRKMTINGLIGIVTGESVDKDKQERKESETSQALSEIDELKRQKDLKDMEVDLEFHDNNDVERLERKEKKPPQETEEDKYKRELNELRAKYGLPVEEEPADLGEDEDPDVVRMLAQMSIDLEFHDNASDVEKIERKFEKEYKNLLEGFDRDFSIITPEDQIRMIEEDFADNKED